ncbi:sugar phosphate nucleotidyltransferase [Stygiolobus caldivivus]|uniref:Nucleotidyltransferase n=1 Tax=Stygiolobus caldivivus TaxID=2824673 RepID=A0A8D5U4U8_9CREN|nr:NDP-sugar synthase [Stygiolobus caldivivus]BCU69303.1 nucleotidyltransferase [Stygiolobus caldivivus]
MEAIILAGGKGEGLSPYSDKEQKETISLLGRMLISYSIQGLRKAGIKDFIVVTTEKGRKRLEEDLELKDISIDIVVQKREGINGAVKDGIEKASEDTLVVAFGDILAPEEFYISLVNAYLTSGAEVVVPLIPISEGLQTYGLVKLTDRGIIITNEGSTLALGGAYVIRNEEIDDFLTYLQSKGDKLKYFIWSEEWLDIGYPEDIINGIEMMLKREKTVISDTSEIAKTAIIGKKVIVDDNAIIDDYAVIKGPAYIGKNAYIGTYSLIRDYSSIENNAIIGAYCEIARSSVQPYAEVGSKSYLTSTIVGRKAKLGASVITSSYPASVIRGRISKLGALISPEVQVPHGEVLKPGSKL